MVAVALHAQNKDVTKFLGIPVDGTKAAMIQKLRAKGFKRISYDSDILEGEFNGENVNFVVVTNNNKVYRIMVADKNTRNEADIRIRFNNLCYQFQNNSKYTPISYNQAIPDDEQIYTNMTLYNKRYEADFYQTGIPSDVNEQSYDYSFTKRVVWFTITKYSYGKYGISIYYDNKYNQANGEDL